MTDILVYSPNYAPESTGIAPYNQGMCEHLASKGHRVTVISATPNYPHWKPLAGFSCYRYQTRVLNNVRILYCPVILIRKTGALSRLLFQLSFFISSVYAAAKWARGRKSGSLFATTPSTMPAGLVALIFRLLSTNIRRHLHVQDIESVAAKSISRANSGLVSRSLGLVERFAYNQFSTISTINEALVNVIADRYAQRISVINNWVDLNFVYSTPPCQYPIAQLNHQDTVVTYSGSINEKQCLELLIDAARLSQARSDEIKFFIVGDGPSKNELKKRAADLDNVFFHPALAYDTYVGVLKASTVNIMLQPKDNVDGYFPSKLVTMIAASRPVIAVTPFNSPIANTFKRTITVCHEHNARHVLRAVYQALEESETKKIDHTDLKAYDRNVVMAAFEAILTGQSSIGNGD